MESTLTCKGSILHIYAVSIDDIDQRIWGTENNKSEKYVNSKGKRLGYTIVQGHQGKPPGGLLGHPTL